MDQRQEIRGEVLVKRLVAVALVLFLLLGLSGVAVGTINEAGVLALAKTWSIEKRLEFLERRVQKQSERIAELERKTRTKEEPKPPAPKAVTPLI